MLPKSQMVSNNVVLFFSLIKLCVCITMVYLRRKIIFTQTHTHTHACRHKITLLRKKGGKSKITDEMEK